MSTEKRTYFAPCIRKKKENASEKACGGLTMAFAVTAVVDGQPLALVPRSQCVELVEAVNRVTLAAS